MKANAEQEEVVPPALNLTAQQLFWVGYGQDHCLENLNLRYDEFEDMLEDWVTGNPIVFIICVFSLQDDSHAPAPWRVNTVLSNQKEFAEDFKCPVGAKLNPAKRCIVW